MEGTNNRSTEHVEEIEMSQFQGHHDVGVGVDLEGRSHPRAATSPEPFYNQPTQGSGSLRGLQSRDKTELPTSISGSDATFAILDLVQQNDIHHPIHWPLWKKWGIASTYCLLQVFVTLTSTTYLSAEPKIQEKFGGSRQLVTLGQSLFICGNAVGPAFMGPLSDIGGRKWVYFCSISLFALLNFGTAFAPNLPTLSIFMFFAGVAGSTAVTNVAGTIADLFGDVDAAGQVMALFVVSANVGPSLGAPLGVWICENKHLGFRWIFIFNIIFGFGYSAFLALVPETLPRIVISRKALMSENVSDEQAAILAARIDFWKELSFVTTMTFKILCTEPIIVTLGLFNGFTYGILFLYLDAVWDVFVENNHLSVIDADLTYLNFVVGVVLMFAFIPVQTYFYKKDREANGRNRPEARFLTSLVTVWGFPLSLFWFAYTSNGTFSPWSPIIAGTLLAFVDPLLWLAMLNYITDAYPNVAASALAAFFIPSFLIAAGLSHAGLEMFESLSTTQGMSICAIVSIALCLTVYFIVFRGQWLRSKSKFARQG